jgi:flagellar biosynthesis protein FlhG
LERPLGPKIQQNRAPRVELGLKQAYALLKAVAGARPGIRARVIVTGARSAQTAMKIFGNLAATVGRYLDAQIDFAGYVPVDPHLSFAGTMGKTVVDAFPAAPASTAFRQIAREIVSWPDARALPMAPPAAKARRLDHTV